MTAQLTDTDRAALLAPVDRAHQIHHETHACEACGGLGMIHPHERWIPCLPCNGTGTVDCEWREAIA